MSPLDAPLRSAAAPGADASDAPARSLAVYPAAQFLAVDGANLGDPIADADELIAGDVYMLTPDAAHHRLALQPRPDPRRLTLAPDTGAGTVGSTIVLDSCLTLMSPDGATVEALVLVELRPDRTIREVWLAPLAELAPKQGHALVAIDRAAAPRRFAETACVSFTRGTHITLASGAQVPIEALSIGDRVLTRDSGPQNILWIGQQTMRATGAFAPIRIAAGTLNNENDLIVSPNHRLFVYQRHDAVRAGRAEVLVKARTLLNGHSVTRTSGGFVDYFQLLFHRHEIIYAEGIAAESLMVDPHTRPVLPCEVQEGLSGLDPAMLSRTDMGADLGEGLVDRADAADMLRRASSC